MKLYANGCSFVFGQELVDNDPINKDDMHTAFPAQLDAYNDAWSGSSNIAIANRTMDYVRTHKPDCAIIGWTTWTRSNASYESDRADRLNQSTYKPDHHKFPYRTDDNYLQVLKQTSINIVESLYHWLEYNSVKPVFFFSFEQFTVDVPTLWNGNNWNDAYYGASSWSKFRTQQHPEQAQHDWMANYLKEHIL